MSSIETNSKTSDEKVPEIPVVCEPNERTGETIITSKIIIDQNNELIIDKSNDVINENGEQLDDTQNDKLNDKQNDKLNDEKINEKEVIDNKEKIGEEDIDLGKDVKKLDKKVDEGMRNGSVVASKMTRNKRNSAQPLISETTNKTKVEDNQNGQNSELRLTRSRYGRLQKAKTPNPEMITFNVKRRSSLKNSDTNETTKHETPLKTEITYNQSNDNNENQKLSNIEPKPKKSKRQTSVTPRETGKRKKSDKLETVIDQIKTKTNETESSNRVNPQKQSLKKKQTVKDSVNLKKTIELTGDESSIIVDRSILTTIPPKVGDYEVGDLMWAKVAGYPWWPCMVSLDPITAIYSKISGVSYRSDRVYHVQYFGPQALRGWTSVGMHMPFEGRDKYLQNLELKKANSPKGQSAKIAAKYAIKPSQKKQWDLSVEEAEEAAKMNKEDRVKSLTFEYLLLSKVNLRRKRDANNETSIEGELDSKRKKLNSSPEDIYDFDDDADNVNVSQSTPGLMWRKRVQKGDFETYKIQHLSAIRKENPNSNDKEIDEMLQKRWDLLGEDLRALYIDRKSGLKSESDENPSSSPKTTFTKKTKSVSTKRKSMSNVIKKTKPKSKVENNDELEINSSNGSDSEGNLVIAETPIKRTPIKKPAKSLPKKALNTSVLNSSSPKKSLNSDKIEIESNALQVIKTPKKSVKKATKPRTSSVTASVKKIEENNKSSVIEKPILQNTVQSLVNFGIDYLDEFTSSEETSSTSEPEVSEASKASFDKFCALCNDEESETLMLCQGNCLQMFHKKCAKYEGIDTQFKCNECESGKHSCFVCKKVENKDNNETQKCNDSKCGKFYHINCLEKNFPVKFTELKDNFICPLHYCLNCHIESQNDKDFRPSRRRLVKCIYCPTAYHLGDYCIAAGTVQVSQNYVICPDHYECGKKKKTDKHLNVNYCFSCLTGGQLICCESCPAAFHSNCLDWVLDPDSNFYCGDCTARKQLHYGDIVWVKLGFYRWWPGKVSHPKQVPDNVMKLAHGVGEFPVYFFGSHDYYWVHRGRVFLFMEGDNKVVTANSGTKKSNKSLLKTFKLAMEESVEQFKCWQESKIAIRRAMVTSKPPSYIHIRSNKPVGPKVQISTSDESQISLCECKVVNDVSCFDENCINRALMVECDPKLCSAADKCKNQRFKKREYVLTKPFKTESAGWGLRCLEDIKKGQFVIEYVGELIDEEECERRLKEMADNNQSNFYFLTIDKDKIIDAGPKGNLARFMNHCCQPNCETQKWMVCGATRVGLFAVSDIPAGTELTFNYNLDCRGNEKTRCVCGSSNCPGFIGVRPNKLDDNLTKKTATNGANHKKKKKKNEKKDFSRMHDDECFTCGEGGDLIMCDKKGCPKSYHLECLKLPQIPKGKWECPRHFCDSCGKPATAMCSFCPNSLCKEHAIPSKLTQLPDGGLLCSDHANEDINGVLIEPEVNTLNDNDIETLRKDDTKTPIETVVEKNTSSTILDTSISDDLESKKISSKQSECEADNSETSALDL